MIHVIVFTYLLTTVIAFSVLAFVLRLDIGGCMGAFSVALKSTTTKPMRAIYLRMLFTIGPGIFGYLFLVRLIPSTVVLDVAFRISLTPFANALYDTITIRCGVGAVILFSAFAISDIPYVSSLNYSFTVGSVVSSAAFFALGSQAVRGIFVAREEFRRGWLHLAAF